MFLSRIFTEIIKKDVYVFSKIAFLRISMDKCAGISTYGLQIFGYAERVRYDGHLDSLIELR
jgi:hypothetical protein